MGTIKEIRIKNRTYYFFHDMTKSHTEALIFITLDRIQ